MAEHPNRFKSGKGEESFTGSVGLECPHCGAQCEEEAAFCPECAKPLKGGRPCPRCGAISPLDGDICEVCGAWLLEGQCKFCYAPLEEGARFCGECGNPVEGITCPRCGHLSYFDFCKECGLPLTERSHEAIEAIKNSQEFRALEAILQGPEEAQSSKEELDRIKEYCHRVASKEGQSKVEARPLFSKGADEVLEGAKRLEQSKGEVQRLLDALQRRPFRNNQEARCFFGALRLLLPVAKIRRRPVGWRCNAFGVVHPEGPQACTRPQDGGEWVFEEHLESSIEEVEV